MLEKLTLIENYLLKKIRIDNLTEEEVKNTPEGLQYCLSVMNSREEVKNILNKYELRNEDYKGFRKLYKRFKAAIEITRIELRNEDERQKALNATLKNRISNLVLYFFNN